MKEKTEKTYRVLRFYKKSGKRKLIMKHVSLDIAQLHCKSPKTSKEGVWFDGYEEE